MSSKKAADEHFARLHAAGWSVGEACFATVAGPVWQVDGRNVQNVMLAAALTQKAARLAVELAVRASMVKG